MSVFKTSLGTVVILPLIGYTLKQLILDQSRQNEYQTVLFGVYTHKMMFVFIVE